MITEVKKFFQDAIFFDKKYFEEIYKTYRKELAELFNLFQREGNTIFIMPLTLPNELYDFLDGNGFLFDDVGNRICITKIVNDIEQDYDEVTAAPNITVTTTTPLNWDWSTIATTTTPNPYSNITVTVPHDYSLDTMIWNDPQSYMTKSATYISGADLTGDYNGTISTQATAATNTRTSF